MDSSGFLMAARSSMPLRADTVAAPGPGPGADAQLGQPNAPQRALHEGVSCDMCKVSPIPGTRYKCGNCPNYDLCMWCEAIEGRHVATHVFIKIDVPLPAPFSGVENMTQRPLLSVNLYDQARNLAMDPFQVLPSADQDQGPRTFV